MITQVPLSLNAGVDPGFIEVSYSFLGGELTLGLSGIEF